MRYFALLFFVVFGFSTLQAQCNYTLVLGDSFGDGWNGGQMILVQNGDTIAFLIGPDFNPNSGANDTTVIVSVIPGLPVELIWNVPGNWPTEMSVALFDENGVQVFLMPNNSAVLALTTLFTSTPTCAPCNGNPTPGNTISSNGSALCNGATTVLTLQNPTLGADVSYQWFNSTDGITFSPITGATSPTYSITAAVDEYFYCAVTCSGFTTTNSTTTHITINLPNQCYCEPIYFNGTQAGDLISNVEIIGTTLANNTGFIAGGPSYTFFTGQPNYTATLLPSASYSLAIATGEYGSQGYAAWIDYNDDGFFTINERIGYTIGTIGTGFTMGQVNDSSSFIISLTCNPPSGIHRLRIRGAYFTDGDQIDPCLSYGFGETEDYNITIAPPPACPSAGLVVSTTTTQTSATVGWLLSCSSSTIFDLEYGPVGFTPGSGTFLNNQTITLSSDTASFTFNGLTPNTEYTFYYRANCGLDSSLWSAANDFRTLCSSITALGWCEGFDSDSQTEQCWTVLNLNNDFSAWDTNTDFNQLNGNNCASISTDFNAGANDDWLITPQLTLTGTEILSFNYRVISSFEPNDMKIKISTTGNSPSDFTQTLMSLDSIANITYQDTSINLSSFTGNVYIAFHVPAGGLDGWILYLDQICIQACAPATITNDSIEICQTADSLDLTTVLNIGQSLGSWSLAQNPTALNGSMLDLNALTTGNYLVNYLVNNACQSTSAYALVNLYEPSNAGIDSAVILCKGQPFDLFNALTGTFQTSGTWYSPSNQPLPGSFIVTENFPGQFNYDYIMTNGVCPSDTSNALLIINDCIYVGLDELKNEKVTVYPNPTSDVLNINATGIFGISMFYVQDLNGRLVYQQESTFETLMKQTIDVSKLGIGLYHLIVINKDEKWVIPFSKN